MTKKEGGKNTDKPNTDTQSPDIIQNNPTVGTQHEEQPETPSKTTEIKKKRIGFSYFKSKNSQPIIANFISIFALIVSTILAIVTYQLYNIASGQVDSVKKAGDAAQSSAITAQNTLKETIDYNEKYLKLQKDVFDSATHDSKKSEIRNDERDKRAKISLDAQIQSLKETQKEFEIENRPLLQIGDIKNDTLIKGKRVSIRFNFINYGKQPAKVLINKCGLIFSPKSHLDKEFDKTAIQQSFDSYLSGNSTLPDQIRTSDTLTKMEYEFIRDNKINIFLTGNIEFENTVTYKKSVFIYLSNFLP